MLLTLGSDAKNSMRTEGTSAKSVGHLVPETIQQLFIRSDCFLMTKWAIFQLFYHGENKLQLNEM